MFCNVVCRTPRVVESLFLFPPLHLEFIYLQVCVPITGSTFCDQKPALYSFEWQNTGWSGARSAQV